MSLLQVHMLHNGQNLNTGLSSEAEFLNYESSCCQSSKNV